MQTNHQCKPTSNVNQPSTQTSHLCKPTITAKQPPMQNSHPSKTTIDASQPSIRLSSLYQGFFKTIRGGSIPSSISTEIDWARPLERWQCCEKQFRLTFWKGHWTTLAKCTLQSNKNRTNMQWTKTHMNTCNATHYEDFHETNEWQNAMNNAMNTYYWTTCNDNISMTHINANCYEQNSIKTAMTTNMNNFHKTYE